MTDPVTITLPFPPSVNRLYRSFKGRSIKSKAYREWEKEAAWSLVAQKPRPIKGRYKLTLLLTPPDKRKRDLGNLEKAISDALQTAGVIENDHLCRRLVIEWPDACDDLPEITVMA